MSCFSNKIKKNNGFTLMELLIVVSILAILLAVSFPVFTNQVNEAKDAADMANLRAAEALANSMYILDGEEFESLLYYDISTEDFVAEPPTPYGKSNTNLNCVITVHWNSAEERIEVQWEKIK